jgi:hypothetical protein
MTQLPGSLSCRSAQEEEMGDNQANMDANGQAAGDELAVRDRVVENLSAKILKLAAAIFALQRRQPQTAAIAQQIANARFEAELCEARRDAIIANGPFNDPGPAAENALLTAMNQVDAATAAAAATSALLAAAHNLVQAYRGA